MGAKEYIDNRTFKNMIQGHQIKKDFVIVEWNTTDNRDIILYQVYKGDGKMYLSKWFIADNRMLRVNEEINESAYQSLLTDYTCFGHDCINHKEDTIYKVGLYKSMCSVNTDVPMEFRKLYKIASDTFSFVLKDNRLKGGEE